MPDAQKYSYMVRWSDEDAEYVATVSEFPSLSCLKPDPVDAVAELIEIVSEILVDMTKSGETCPEPDGVPELKDLRLLWDAIGSRCHVCKEPGTRTGKCKGVVLHPPYECCDKHEAPVDADYVEYPYAGAIRRLRMALGKD